MNCANCKQAFPIPACMHELVIGKIDDTLKDVFVMFRDITTGRKTIFPAKSTNDGTVKLELSDIMFPENHSFEITISPDMAGNTNLDVTIDDTKYSCIGAQFEKLRSESGDIEHVTSHTLKMEP